MKSNKLITVLIVLAILLSLLLAAVVGFLWYRNTHIFIEESVYSKKAQSLDLREENISFQHYDSLKSQLPECSILWSVPFHGGKVSSGTMELSITDLTETDIEIITKYFPELQKVDASDCQNYEILDLLRKKAPNLSVIYQISLGATGADPDAEELTLSPEAYDYEVLLENLGHLKKLKNLHLKAPELTLQQIDKLREDYPSLKITCTIDLNGQEYDMETEDLDLSQMDPASTEEAIKKLPMLPALKTVQLNGEDGNSAFSKEQVKLLMDAVPQVTFYYAFDFYGEKLDTSMEEIIIKHKSIGDEGEPEIRKALDILRSCKRFVLDGCKISNEVMAKLRDDYRDQTKVVWRIYFGEGTSLTDAEVLRSTYNVEDDNSHDLVYLEDVRYMDIGHNEFLDSIDFIRGMTSLEVVIVSGAPIKSLEPFENCKNLRVLEMANCIYVPDLEPLRNLKNLKLLNIGFTRISDLSPIEDLELTHLTMMHNKIPNDVRQAYKDGHPDCWTVTEGKGPYGIGWRYDEEKEFLPWYADIKNVFRYPKSPNNVGWYLDKKD